jgi:hypothetical protein
MVGEALSDFSDDFAFASSSLAALEVVDGLLVLACTSHDFFHSAIISFDSLWHLLPAGNFFLAS